MAEIELLVRGCRVLIDVSASTALDFVREAHLNDDTPRPTSPTSPIPPAATRPAHPPAGTSLGAEARRGRGWRRVPPAARIVALVSVAALVSLGVLWGRCGVRGCPNVDGLTSYQPGRAPVLLDRNG